MMGSFEIDLSSVNPPESLVREWVKGIPTKGNPSLYMRQCYLRHGVEQGALTMCLKLRSWVANHQQELVDVDELFDELFEAPAVGTSGRSLASLLEDEVRLIEACPGLTDESTPAGEAWARIHGILSRYTCQGDPLPPAPGLPVPAS